MNGQATGREGKKMIVWRAYCNDDVELSDRNGCKTKKQAVDLCKKDREYVTEESSDGSELGFTYRIEKVRETEAEIEVLEEIELNFRT